MQACSQGTSYAVLVYDKSGTVTSELLFSSATSCYGANTVEVRFAETSSSKQQGMRQRRPLLSPLVRTLSGKRRCHAHLEHEACHIGTVSTCSDAKQAG